MAWLMLWQKKGCPLFAWGNPWGNDRFHVAKWKFTSAWQASWVAHQHLSPLPALPSTHRVSQQDTWRMPWRGINLVKNLSTKRRTEKGEANLDISRSASCSKVGSFSRPILARTSSTFSFTGAYSVCSICRISLAIHCFSWSIFSSAARNCSNKKRKGSNSMITAKI